MIGLMDSRRQELELAMAGAKQDLPLLVGSDGGQPVIIGASDDRGIYVYATAIGDQFDLPVPQAVDYVLLPVLAIGLVVGAASLCMLVRTWLARAVVIIALLMLAARAITVGDVYIASCAAMGVFPLMVLCVRRKLPIGALVAIALVAGLYLGMLQTIRSHAATSIILMSLPILAVGLKAAWRQRVAMAVAGCVGLVVVLAWFHSVVVNAERYVESRQGESLQHVKAHPMWHSIYIGVGFLDNPWGIKYRDGYAADAVAAVDPSIPYCSPAYEAVLKGKVIDLVKARPMFMLELVFAKLGVMIMFLLLFANFGLLAIWYRRPERDVAAAVVIGLAFNSLFGLLVMPLESYVMGFIALSTIFGAWSIGRATDKWLNADPATVKPPEST